MPAKYEIMTVRKMTILDGLKNPVDGYRVAFRWTDSAGRSRTSYIEIDEASATSEGVKQAIEAEIEKIESWMK